VNGYQLQANCYLSKPVQLDAFESLVKSINGLWLTKAKLPPSGPADDQDWASERRGPPARRRARDRSGRAA
jgi:hypothetical protein